MSDCEYCQDDIDEVDEPEEYCTQCHWKAWAKKLKAKIYLLEYEIAEINKLKKELALLGNENKLLKMEVKLLTCEINRSSSQEDILDGPMVKLFRDE